MIRILFILLVFIISLFASAKKEFTVSFDPDYAPFSYTIDEKPYGLLIDIWKLWAKKNDLEVKFINAQNWDNALELVKKGEVDYFLGTDAYEEWMESSTAIYKTKASFFTLKSLDKEIKIIGIIGADYKDVLEERFKDSKILVFKDYESIIDSLLDGSIDAIYDDYIAINDFIFQNRKNHLIKANEFFQMQTFIHAISDNKKLIDFFNYNFQNLTIRELQKVEDEWILNSNDKYYNKSIDSLLTKDEKEWLDNNPISRFAIMSYWPMDDNGESIHSSVIKLINKYAGTNIVPIKFDAWRDGFKKASVGEDIQGLMGLSWSKEREEKYFNYSPAYDFTSCYLITRKDNNDIFEIKDLKDKTIYLKTKSITLKMMADKSPSTKIIELPTTEKMYEMLASSKNVDAMISYFKDDKLLSKYNLKIVKVIYDKYGEVAVGVNHKYPYLSSIIDKAFKIIPKTEFSKLRMKEWGNQVKLNLTEKEKNWIKQNHTIKVHNEYNWPPFNFNRNSKPMGYSIDYMNLLAKKVGINVEYVTGEWNELLEKAYKKEIDVMLNIVKNSERQKHLIYTKSYAKNPINIIARTDNNQIKDIESLFGKTVAVVEGFYDEKILKDNYPQIKRYYVKNLLEALKAVIYKKADATLVKIVIANYIIKENMLLGLESKGEFTTKNPENTKLNIAMRNDYHILQGILNKAIDSVTIDEEKIIKEKWVFSRPNKNIDFNQKEKEYIKKKKNLSYVFNPDWKPIDWSDKVVFQTGMVLDVLKLISENSGLKLNAISTNSWEESLEKVKNKEAEMIVSVLEDSEKREFLDFTQGNIFSIPAVIITKKSDETLYFDKNNINGKKIVYLKSKALETYLKRNYPNSKLISIENIDDAFIKLKNKNADIFIINAASAKYYLKAKNLDKYKISTKIDYNFDIKIALSKELSKEALSVIDKSIKNIDKKDLDDIYHKWTEVLIKEQIDWTLFLQALGVISLVIIAFIINNFKLKSLVNKKTEDIQKQKEKLELLVSSFDKNVIFYQTDKKGNITHVSRAFSKLSGYEKEELIGKGLDTFNEEFKNIIKDMKSEVCIFNELKYMRKDGSFYWTESKFEPEYDNKNEFMGYNILIQNITDKKAFENLNKTLEQKVNDRTKEIELQKKQIEIILENILLPVLITSKKSRKILYANKYSEIQYETSVEDLVGSSIDTVYTVKNQKNEILTQLNEKGFVENLEQHYKTYKGKEFTGLLSVKPIVFNNEDCFIGMVVDITKQKEIEKEIRKIHKQTRDSIEYASVIQHTLIPDNELFRKYFKDYFTIWHPKDLVGGDIYFFEELRSQDECLLMVIDCTGHGVSGAFVTMLVKAIERQIISKIVSSSEEVNPARILELFNTSMKHLLKQYNKESISDVGFDGQVLYFNKKDKKCIFASARNPLFYIQEDELISINGDRSSIGYVKSKEDFKFKNHEIDISKPTKFYISSDGYWDQNGGEKGLPYGKKRLKKLLSECNHESMADIQEILLYELNDYQGKNQNNDDITFIGIEV